MFQVKNKEELGELLNILSSSIGSLTNPEKLKNTIKSENKSKISSQTIKKYIDYFEDSFLIESAQRYDIKGKAYKVTPKKYYFSDLGLRNLSTNFSQLEPNFCMENVCNLGSSRYYIQSAYSLPDETERSKIIRSFRKIDDSFKKIIITKDFVQPYYDDYGILTVNIYDFLLDPETIYR